MTRSCCKELKEAYSSSCLQLFTDHLFFSSFFSIYIFSFSVFFYVYNFYFIFSFFFLFFFFFFFFFDVIQYIANSENI